MLFNIHYGQKRVGVIPGKGRAMVFRPTAARKMLIMQGWNRGKPTKEKAEYRADALGNIDVIHPKHIETMMGLGHPLYDGDGKAPVKPEDLLWPTLELDSEYWKRINRALKRKMKSE